MNIKEHALEIANCKRALAIARDKLFTDDLPMLMARIKLICDVETMWRPKPPTCTSPYTIHFGIKELSINDLLNHQYPASEIEWDIIDGDYGKMIIAQITAIYNGETDCIAEFVFPADIDDFDQYMVRLNGEMAQRKSALEKNQDAKISDIEKQERAELLRLLEKYPDARP